MPRIRTIKPEFWTSEQIVECSTNARLLFVGLWNFCDDGGIHPASYKQLKMKIYPGDDFAISDIKTWVDELLRKGLIIEYEFDGDGYWQVIGWRHQKIDRPSFKYYHSAESDLFVERSTNSRRTFVPYSIVKESKGKDSIGTNNAHFENCANRFYSHHPVQKNKDQAIEEFIAICHNSDFDQKQADDFCVACLFAIQNQKHEKDALAKYNLSVPAWKYPDTWLQKKCWKEKVETAEAIKRRAIKEKRYKPTTEECFDNTITEEQQDVIPFS